MLVHRGYHYLVIYNKGVYSMLIGLSGKAGNGKDTVAKYLETHHEFIPLAFADPVKRGLEAMFRLDHKWLNDTEAKEQDIPELGVSGRVLMQTLGTEWGRNLIDENIWVDLMRRKILMLDTYDIVVTDVRFDNEAALIQELGGTLITVVREGKKDVGILGHASEAGLTSSFGSLILHNEGSKEELFKLVDKIL
jgi:hypothetical protein